MNKKISLPTSKGMLLVKIEDIIRIETEGPNNTNVFLEKNIKLVTNKSIVEIQLLLHEHDFCRVQYYHLINLHKIARYSKHVGEVVMMDNIEVPIPRRRENMFLQNTN